MNDYKTWRIEVIYLAASLRPTRIEWKVEHHLWIVTLRLIVGVASWMFSEMRKEVLVAGTVPIVGRRLYWVIFHAVALRV